MGQIRLHVLMENTSCRDGICAEHGLSLYLETPRHRLLFDTGQTGAFAQNADAMGVDLAQVDLAILSHGHYDHGGGLRTFLERNQTAPVYLSRFAFAPHFSGRSRSIGLDAGLRECDRLIVTGDHTVIDEELALFSCNDWPRPFPLEPFGLYMEGGDGQLVPEDFRHEQYLLLHDGDRRVLISGCSHKGILNLVEWFQPDVLVGGFHLMKLDADGADRARILDLAHRLAGYPTVYYTGHCTGERQYLLLQSVLGDRLHAIRAGACLDL